MTRMSIEIRTGPPGSASAPWVAIAAADLAGRAAMLRIVLAPGEAIEPSRSRLSQVSLYVAEGTVGLTSGAGGAMLAGGDLAILGPATDFACGAGAAGATLLLITTPGADRLESAGTIVPGGTLRTVPARGGTQTVLAGDLYTVKRRGAETGGLLGLLHFAIPPGGGPIPHVHLLEEEAFYVLDGVLSLFADGLRTHAEKGALIFLPRSLPHGFHNLTDAPAAMLCLLSPGGGEAFFLEAGKPPGQEGATGRPDPGEIARILAVADRFGVQMRPEIDQPYLPPPRAAP